MANELDLHSVLLEAITARMVRAEAATKGPWRYVGRNWIEPAEPIDPTEADWGPEGHTSFFVHTNEGQGAWRVEDVIHIAAEDPAAVLRHVAEDLWTLSQHKPNEADVARNLDPECSCGYDLHRTCPHIESLVRRYAVKLCSTCGGTGQLKCVAHVAGDGCDELVLTCPDCPLPTPRGGQL